MRYKVNEGPRRITKALHGRDAQRGGLTRHQVVASEVDGGVLMAQGGETERADIVGESGTRPSVLEAICATLRRMR